MWLPQKSGRLAKTTILLKLVFLYSEACEEPCVNEGMETSLPTYTQL